VVRKVKRWPGDRAKRSNTAHRVGSASVLVNPLPSQVCRKRRDCWWGLALALVFPVLFAIRVRIEERALIEGLPGYADYAARVRYRLMPGVW
jgi:hypothetical protein